MQKTLQGLITDTQKALYQSAGPGVQMYAQDLIAAHIQQAFKHCYRAAFWPQFRKREVRTLDGLTGQITVPLTYIKDWEDLQHVYRRNSPVPLPQLPAALNTLDIPAGTTARWIEASGDAKLFFVYPFGATDNIVAIGRKTWETEFTLTDTVPFDDLALVHFAAWSYFTDDASNPASALKHQGLYERRMQTLKSDAFSHAVQLNSQSGHIPNQWYERC